MRYKLKIFSKLIKSYFPSSQFSIFTGIQATGEPRHPGGLQDDVLRQQAHASRSSRLQGDRGTVDADGLQRRDGHPSGRPIRQERSRRRSENLVQSL